MFTFHRPKPTNGICIHVNSLFVPTPLIRITALTDLLLFSLIVGAAIIAYVLIRAVVRIRFGEIKTARGWVRRQDDAMEERVRQEVKCLRWREQFMGDREVSYKVTGRAVETYFAWKRDVHMRLRSC